jgi:hypothetical protein
VQEHAVQLRECEIQFVQGAIEVEVAWLGLLRHEQEHQTSTVRTTQSITQRATSHRQKIRTLVASLQAWQVFMQPAGCPAPAYDEDALFAGQLPWRPETRGSSKVLELSKSAMELELYKAQHELDRTAEELSFFPADVCCLLNNNRHQRSVLVKFIAQNAQRLSPGVLFVLSTKLQTLHSVYRDAKELLLPCLVQGHEAQ